MKKREYFLTFLTVSFILGFVFFIKNVFPFGNDYLIWSDMHAQVVPFYYKFYDSFYNNGSLLFDMLGGGVNFWGVFSYYLLSPFTFVVLLFKRNMIEHAATVITFLKFITCSMTTLYFFRKRFSNTPFNLRLIFTLLYTFSSYILTCYVITGWIDVVYMLPLVIDGLIDLLDRKSSKKYIVCLSLSLIMNFYLSGLLLIFIIIFSFLYKKYKNIRKNSILDLGVSTLIAFLISGLFLIPTFYELSNSIRSDFSLKEILYSGTGPIVDKFAYLVSSSILFSIITYDIFKSKFKNIKKYFPIFMVFLLPIIIEPINKMLHFGSYNFFPYRYGFIFTFVLIVYSFSYLKEINSKNHNIKNDILRCISLLIFGATYVLLSFKFYDKFQYCVDKLTWSRDKKSFIIFLILFLIIYVLFIILIKFRTNKRYLFFEFFLLTLLIVISNSLFYFKIDSQQSVLKKPYYDSKEIKKLNFDNYKLKIEDGNVLYNFGLVMNKHTIDYWTSIADEKSYSAYKKLGYNSSVIDATSSDGGNLFFDLLLGNKYLYSNKDNPYYYGDDLIKQSIYSPSIGYFFDQNLNFDSCNNSFQIANEFSNKIFGESFFDINTIGILDEYKIDINGIKNVYLELDNKDVKKAYDIYVNGILLFENYPSFYSNGTIDLGKYSNETITIKIINKTNDINKILIGTLDINKVNKYFSKEHANINMKVFKNKISINLENNGKKYLFLPINYLEGMNIKLNNKSIKNNTALNNFIVISLEDNYNDIEISFVPPYMILGLFVTIIGILASIIYSKNKQIVNNELLSNTASYLFNMIFYIIVIFVYLLPGIFFFLSFFRQL